MVHRGLLERTLLASLQPGSRGEGLELPDVALPALEAALCAELRGRDPLPGLLAALRIAAALDASLDSPAAAERVRMLLRGNATSASLIRALLRPVSVDVLRAFAKREGREPVLRAPRLDEPAPPRARPLRELIPNRLKELRGVTHARRR